MVTRGDKQSSEEFGPHELIRAARRAEEIGFTFATTGGRFFRGSPQERGVAA
jgi:hypothetical protein